MEVNSGEELCKLLISQAFQRCRMLDDLCRLSISLKRSSHLVRISVSDTGVGSNLEEFKELNCQSDPIFASKWDGVLCISTTSISDQEIHRLKFYIRENGSSKRLVRLPSTAKNGAKFSGTEVSFSVSEEIDILSNMICTFVRKMLILKVPKIAVDLSVDPSDRLGSLLENVILQNTCNTLPLHAENIDYLKLGLEDYVSKHGNRAAEACRCCFSTGNIDRDNMKVGAGLACSKGKKGAGQVMEAVIIISETSVPGEPSCSRLYAQKSEVMFFRNFLPSSISPSSLDALTSIEWKNYGLALRSVSDLDGLTLIEWENLQPGVHIDIALHGYNREVMPAPRKQNNEMDRSLTRKAIMLALNELKENNEGFLLSGRAVKICNYAPDLARTISGLILSSHDLNFQKECLSLLELQPQETERKVVENCIKDKIISVVAMNDRLPKAAGREATSLFTGEAYQEPYNSPEASYEEDQEDNEAFVYLDL